MTVRAVVFDVDGTLVDDEGSVRAALAEWLPELAGEMPGFGLEPARLRELELLWAALEDKHQPARRAAGISLAELRRRRLRDFLPEVGVTEDAQEWPAEELDDLFHAYLLAYERHWSAYADAAPALTRMREAGLVVGVLSNGIQTQLRRKLEATELIDLCDEVLSSERLGAMLPDLRAYAALCEQLELAPEEVLVVGDNYELDVQAPRSAGLPAIHLSRGGRNRSADPARIRSLRELDPAAVQAAAATADPAASAAVTGSEG